MLPAPDGPEDGADADNGIGLVDDRAEGVLAGSVGEPEMGNKDASTNNPPEKHGCVGLCPGVRDPVLQHYP